MSQPGRTARVARCCDACDWECLDVCTSEWAAQATRLPAPGTCSGLLQRRRLLARFGRHFGRLAGAGRAPSQPPHGSLFRGRGFRALQRSLLQGKPCGACRTGPVLPPLPWADPRPRATRSCRGGHARLPGLGPARPPSLGCLGPSPVLALCLRPSPLLALGCGHAPLDGLRLLSTPLLAPGPVHSLATCGVAPRTTAPPSMPASRPC